MEKIKRDRIEWVDVSKYICIMFVMLSHLESGSKILDCMYTPFFLTVFFFCSGYVYKNEDEFKEFMFKKIRGLLIPWFIFSNFNIILSAIFSFNSHGSLVSELTWNIFQIRGKGDELWFVSALFMAFIPFYFLVKLSENDVKKGAINNYNVIIISWVLSLFSIIYNNYINPDIFPWKSSALPWHIEYIFQAVFFMILGYYFRTTFEKTFDKYNNKLNRKFIFCLYIILVLISFLFEDRMILHVKIIFNYIIQVMGIILIVIFSKLIKSTKYIKFIGRNTILYFALHGKVLSMIQTILKKFTCDIYIMLIGNVLTSSLLAIGLTYIISVILIIPVYIIEKYMPFTLGRKNIYRNKMFNA